MGPAIGETFEKCSFLFELEKGDIFNHPDQNPIGTDIHTLGVLRIKKLSLLISPDHRERRNGAKRGGFQRSQEVSI